MLPAVLAFASSIYGTLHSDQYSTPDTVRYPWSVVVAFGLVVLIGALSLLSFFWYQRFHFWAAAGFYSLFLAIGLATLVSSVLSFDDWSGPLDVGVYLFYWLLVNGLLATALFLELSDFRARNGGACDRTHRRG